MCKHKKKSIDHASKVARPATNESTMATKKFEVGEEEYEHDSLQQNSYEDDSHEDDSHEDDSHEDDSHKDDSYEDDSYEDDSYGDDLLGDEQLEAERLQGESLEGPSNDRYINAIRTREYIQASMNNVSSAYYISQHTVMALQLTEAEVSWHHVRQGRKNCYTGAQPS
jgi:hypothetical protein